MSDLDDERVKRLDWYYTVLSPQFGLVWVYPLTNGMWAGFSGGGLALGEASLSDAIGGSASYSAEEAIRGLLS